MVLQMRLQAKWVWRKGRRPCRVEVQSGATRFAFGANARLRTSLHLRLFALLPAWHPLLFSPPVATTPLFCPLQLPSDGCKSFLLLSSIQNTPFSLLCQLRGCLGYCLLGLPPLLSPIGLFQQAARSHNPNDSISNSSERSQAHIPSLALQEIENLNFFAAILFVYFVSFIR